MTALASRWSGALAAPPAATGGRLLQLLLLATPVLWVLGLLVPASVVLICYLAVKRWPEGAGTNLIVGVWFLTAGAQAVAVAYNWSLTDEPLSFLVGKLFGFPVLGWVMLGLCIAVGRSWQLARPSAVRGVTYLALHALVFGVAGLAGAYLTKWPYFFIYTPLFPLLGNSPSANFYATAVFWHPEEGSFGLPRLVLFYPWATALGIAGLCMTVISLCEADWRWRAVGVLGGVFSVLFSFSRAAIAILPVALACYALLRLSRTTVIAGILVVSIAALGCVLLGVDPLSAVNDVLGSLRESRAGSSEARELIYDRSYEAFLQAPIFGNGWVGDSLMRQEVLPIGSHSTLFGVLYMGGVTTFACLCTATLALLVSVLFASGRPARRETAAAFAILVAFILFGYGEGLYNLVLPCCFAFLFMGGALAPAVGPER